MTTHYYLGIDIGGTKSHGLIADETGRAIVLKENGCGNPEAIGYEGMTQVIGDLIQRTLKHAGLALEQISAAGFGIAGYDWPSQSEAIARAIRAAGLTAPISFVNDVELGLIAGTRDGWGVVIEAGTGCNARGRDRSGNTGRSIGYGMRFGERAGAVEIVAEAVTAVAQEWTLSGPPTSLTRAFLERVGAAGTADFLEGLVSERYATSPADATLVFEHAGAGDAAAQAIIQWAGQGLGQMANGVVRQLALETLPFEVVMIGSLFRSQALTQAMQTEIQRVAAQARFTALSAPPVVGAVLLAMQTAGMQVEKLRERVIERTEEWIACEKHPFPERRIETGIRE